MISNSMSLFSFGPPLYCIITYTQTLEAIALTDHLCACSYDDLTQDSPADTRDQYEGSGVDGYDHPLYRPEDEEDDSSGEDTSDWDGEEDLGDSDIVNIDDEIDPRDLDIGFHEEVTIHYQDWWTSSSSSTPATISAKTSVPAMNPNNPSVSDESEEEDPHKHATASQDTNFFSQPGILTGESCLPCLITSEKSLFYILVFK